MVPENIIENEELKKKQKIIQNPENFVFHKRNLKFSEITILDGKHIVSL